MAAPVGAMSGAGVRRARALAFVISLAAAASGFLLFLQFGRADGLDWLDVTRAVTGGHAENCREKNTDRSVILAIEGKVAEADQN